MMECLCVFWSGRWQSNSGRSSSWPSRIARDSGSSLLLIEFKNVLFNSFVGFVSSTTRHFPDICVCCFCCFPFWFGLVLLSLDVSLVASGSAVARRCIAVPRRYRTEPGTAMRRHQHLLPGMCVSVSVCPSVCQCVSVLV